MVGTKCVKKALESLGVGRVDSMELEVAQQVIAHWESSDSGLENVVQKTILSNRQTYERQVSYFGIVGSNAPFVGLFGTVIGVIISLRNWGITQKAGWRLSVQVFQKHSSQLPGLLVAIPAVIMFNTLKSKIKARVQNSEIVFRHLLAIKKDQPQNEEA